MNSSDRDIVLDIMEGIRELQGQHARDIQFALTGLAEDMRRRQVKGIITEGDLRALTRRVYLIEQALERAGISAQSEPITFGSDVNRVE